MKEQRIRDPIHNLIKFSQDNEDDEILWELLQTSWMQRLRRIKQLGFSDFVFPGANHTRFSHSLGALQMARRMLNVFESKGLINKKDKKYRLKRKATLCAVLLHDVGHGPYSHVFEKVSKDIFQKEDKQEHENYTQWIISDNKQIREILKKPPTGSDALYNEVTGFFKQESGSDQYSRIVSSQLDADRLDFLMRDRYFCGVRFGEIDLEWLLDSIVIKEFSNEVSRYTFVFNEKGKTVAEDFIMAYIHMYENVYYHKAVVALEVMLTEILKGICEQKCWNPLSEYFNSSSTDRLCQYKNLDDSSVIEAIKWASRKTQLGEISELSKRFLNRDIFKSIIIPKDELNKYGKVDEFEKKLKEQSIWYKRNIPKSKGFRSYPWPEDAFVKNLLIMKSGDAVPMHVESNIAKNAEETRPIYFYFKNNHDREEAVEIGQRMGMQL